MVWDSDLNPEGLAEKFHYTVGAADFSATFGQFLYADQNPSLATAGLDGLNGQSIGNDIYLITYSGGMLYHITTNLTAKIGATVYTYYGAQKSTSAGGVSPYFGDVYVGEGAYTGSSQNPYNGSSGYGTGNGYAGNESLGYPNNQNGINNLLVMEFPFELNYRVTKNLDSRLYCDVAYNFQGRQRAQSGGISLRILSDNRATVERPRNHQRFCPSNRRQQSLSIRFRHRQP